MNAISSWLVQVFQMTDDDTRTAAAEILRATGAFTVDERTCERGSFLIVESADHAHALTVYEMVMIADHDAELVHCSTPARPKSVVV